MISSKTFEVYKATSPSNRVYIGITSIGLKERKRLHISESKKSNYAFHNALRKYGESITWEVIATAESWEELCELEKYYIEYYDSYNNGYNCTFGGDGSYGLKVSEESRAKMRGPRPQTSASLRGRTLTAEHRKKVSEARKKLNIQYNREQRETLARQNGARKFAVYKDGQKISEFINKKECAGALGLHPRGIVGCLNQPNIFKSHKGYTFRYLEV